MGCQVLCMVMPACPRGGRKRTARWPLCRNSAWRRSTLQWKITKTRGAAIVVLDMPLLDTREGRDLTGTLVADIVLQLLSYVAQTERELIHQRQAEGIAAALERGVRFGPARIPMPEGFEDLAKDWWQGYVTATYAGKMLGISRKTFTRRATEWGASQGLEN